MSLIDISKPRISINMDHIDTNMTTTGACKASIDIRNAQADTSAVAADIKQMHPCISKNQIGINFRLPAR